MASSLVDETIYLDHAATTPLDPVVIDAMLPYLRDRFGNPSSIYGLGQESKAAIDRARRSVASVLNCSASELIFTGRRVKSEEALRIGLVNAVYPLDQLMDVAIELAESIAANSPLAVRSAKQLIRLAFNGQTTDGLDSEVRAFGEVFATADQKEGMTAFVEKRAAAFQNPS